VVSHTAIAVPKHRRTLRALTLITEVLDCLILFSPTTGLLVEVSLPLLCTKSQTKNFKTLKDTLFISHNTSVLFLRYYLCCFESHDVSKGRLHHRSLNLRSTERVQRLELIQFRVQVICVAQRIFELVLLKPSLNHDLCRSPNLMNSYWLIEHTDTTSLLM